MLFGRRDYLMVQQDLAVKPVPRDVPATEEERGVILAAAQAYLDGDTPLSVRDCGECIARTRKARVSIPERTETNTITYRYEERDVEAKDIVSGFIHPKNEFGLDFNPDTLEPYFPVVKLSFADGSSAVMAITKKADKAEGGEGEKGTKKK